MNQLLVTSNGGAGRALFKFAGARALNVPAAIASATACVGAGDAGCDGAVEHPAAPRLSAAATAATRSVIGIIISVLRRGYFDSGVPRRAGRSSSSRPSASVIETKM